MDLPQLTFAAGVGMLWTAIFLSFNLRHGWVRKSRYDAVAVDVLATAGVALSTVAELLNGRPTIAVIYGLATVLMAATWWANVRRRRNADTTDGA